MPQVSVDCRMNKYTLITVPQNYFASSIRLQLVQYALMRTYSQIATSLVMIRALKRMAVVTSISLWTVSLFEGEARGLVFFSRNNSFMESWTVANPFLFHWIHAFSLNRVSFHICLLESINLLLSTVCNLQCFLCPFALDCNSVRGGISREVKILAHENSVQGSRPPYFPSGVAPGSLS